MDPNSVAHIALGEGCALSGTYPIHIYVYPFPQYNTEQKVSLIPVQNIFINGRFWGVYDSNQSTDLLKREVWAPPELPNLLKFSASERFFASYLYLYNVLSQRVSWGTSEQGRCVTENRDRGDWLTSSFSPKWTPHYGVCICVPCTEWELWREGCVFSVPESSKALSLNPLLQICVMGS